MIFVWKAHRLSLSLKLSVKTLFKVWDVIAVDHELFSCTAWGCRQIVTTKIASKTWQSIWCVNKQKLFSHRENKPKNMALLSKLLQELPFYDEWKLFRRKKKTVNKIVNKNTFVQNYDMLVEFFFTHSHRKNTFHSRINSSFSIILPYMKTGCSLSSNSKYLFIIIVFDIKKSHAIMTMWCKFSIKYLESSHWQTTYERHNLVQRMNIFLQKKKRTAHFFRSEVFKENVDNLMRMIIDAT